MSSGKEPSDEITLEVRGCLCLHLQRAARAVARRFDQAFRPLDLTNGQFSLLTALDRMDQPSIGRVAAVLAMDRTTLTANLKPLERRGLIEVTMDPADKRTRRSTLALGRPGVCWSPRAPIWIATHAALETRSLATPRPDRLRADLARTLLTRGPRRGRRRLAAPADGGLSSWLWERHRGRAP